MDNRLPQLAREKLIEEVEALKKRLDKPDLYVNCGGVMLNKFGSPIPIIDHILITLRRRPDVKFEAIMLYGGKPVRQVLEEEGSPEIRAMRAELLTFLKEHGC